MVKKTLLSLAVLALVFLAVVCRRFTEATGPAQPASGPGGHEYQHARVIKHVYGTGALQYWIFEPDDPRPKSAPLIVFNHGWGGVNPRVYGAWIEHLVRRGNIVVYPRYQEQWKYPPSQITDNVVRAVHDAIGELQNGSHVRPQLDHFAIVGHSAGGQITANMAALAKSSGLPEPKAIMCVEPGNSWNKIKPFRIPLSDLRQIPSNVLLLAVTGADDHLARDIDARRIFNESTNVPVANKNFITVTSDDHGRPALKADHFSPCAFNAFYDSGEKESGRLRLLHHDGDFPNLETGPVVVNALDYYGYWKLFDGLTDAAFYGKNREYALGDTPMQRFMGTWSDGIPVRELIVSEHP